MENETANLTVPIMQKAVDFSINNIVGISITVLIILIGVIAYLLIRFIKKRKKSDDVYDDVIDKINKAFENGKSFDEIHMKLSAYFDKEEIDDIIDAYEKKYP